MSGNFTQRGEIALLGKYTRARHALLAGADAVLELPAVFALSPAEIFARGAVKILSSIPAFEALAFGCETDSKTLLHEAARITAAESEQHRAALRGQLPGGRQPYARTHRSAPCKRDGQTLPRFCVRRTIFWEPNIKNLSTFMNAAQIFCRSSGKARRIRTLCRTGTSRPLRRYAPPCAAVSRKASLRASPLMCSMTCNILRMMRFSKNLHI